MAKRRTTDKDFTPSYESPTQEEYESFVELCRSLSPQSQLYRGIGCKREEHRMVIGGRQGLRHPDLHLPRGPTDSPRSSKRTKKQERELDDRLYQFRAWLKDHPDASEEMAWEWRTQWPDPTYRENAPPSLVSQISTAINRYKRKYERGTGFHVPDTPYTLIDLGMPPKAAWILVNRAAGRFYPEITIGLAEGLPEFGLLDKLQTLTGGNLSFGGNRGRQLLVKTKNLGVLDSIVVRISGKQRTLHEDWWETRKDEWIEEIRAVEGRGYRAIDDDPTLLRDIFDGKKNSLSALLAKRKGANKAILFYFSKRKTPFIVRLSDGEHSKLPADTAREGVIGYKTLNVELRRLPAVLALVTRRKKHEGRRLPARKNPVNDDALIQLVTTHQRAAIEAAIAGRSRTYGVRSPWAFALRCI